MLKIIAGASALAVAAAVPGAPDRHAKKTMNGESAPKYAAAGRPRVFPMPMPAAAGRKGGLR